MDMARLVRHDTTLNRVTMWSPKPRQSSNDSSHATIEPPHGSPFTRQEYTQRRLAGTHELVTEQGYDLASLIEQPITWGHHDHFRHLNNVHTFRFFETGRMKFIESLVQDLPQGAEESLVRGGKGDTGGVILSSISARYKRPVMYPDTLIVGHRVLSISKDRFTLGACCWSFQQQTIVTTGEAVMVCYNYGDLRRMDMTEPMKAALDKRHYTPN
ncbi:hypothetical protein OIO90_004235 [Microbotryomycetes sp. JL221]|nr:hypothetical protein OIO90_004235 [Microbotryomycetes sp. JL221]